MPHIDVLDHGVVRLVNHMGDDLSVVRNARVSYNAAWRAGKDSNSDEHLINYLIRNDHSTPFEAVTFTFEVMAPLFVLRQWHRHRVQSYNELSARYRELPELFYVPSPEQVGVQSTTSKQARNFVNLTAEELSDLRVQLADYESDCREDFRLYQRLLKAGWPRELARMKLPLSTYSHMFTTVNLWNLFRFIKLRTHVHAQYEIRQYAWALYSLARTVVPISIDAFTEHVLGVGETPSPEILDD